MLHYSKTSINEIKSYSIKQNINIELSVKEIAIVDYNLETLRAYKSTIFFRI